MSIPERPAVVPDRVRELAGSAALEGVWVNELGGETFRTDDGRFIKYGPLNAEASFANEAQRLEWAITWIRVPRVIHFGADGTHEWLVTAALEGESAVHPKWISNPAIAVRAVGGGLRVLHDALPVSECPFDWSVPQRILNAEGRNIVLPDRLRDPPPIDRLVVCHGDACCPNTLIDGNGKWSGHVDFGAVGIADRWADIAVASMSAVWNYGPGWDLALIAAYGIEPDPKRLEYYREFWTAT
jgi:kanamycin kinase